MTIDSSLHQRRRELTASELASIPWIHVLSAQERERAIGELKIADASAGEYICRMGRPVTYWFGVVDGLLKMSSDNAEGQTMTFTGVPPGGWFGEGTAMKREAYRYNIQSLRKSRVAGLHVDTFHWLLDHSIGFNRFVMNQLNERLGQFIAAREIDRMTGSFGYVGTVQPQEPLAVLMISGSLPTLVNLNFRMGSPPFSRVP